MKTYIFYDTDLYGQSEYNICQDEYKELIRTLCKYSTTFSVLKTNPNTESSDMFNKLKNFEIEKSADITHKFSHYREKTTKVFYYRVCPELCEIILQNTDNIFCWIDGWDYKNPEDPTFYRENGSILFTSTIHDGECALFVENENFENILSNKLWLKETDEGFYRQGMNTKVYPK